MAYTPNEHIEYLSLCCRRLKVSKGLLSRSWDQTKQRCIKTVVLAVACQRPSLPSGRQLTYQYHPPTYPSTHPAWSSPWHMFIYLYYNNNVLYTLRHVFIVYILPRGITLVVMCISRCLIVQVIVGSPANIDFGSFHRTRTSPRPTQYQALNKHSYLRIFSAE